MNQCSRPLSCLLVLAMFAVFSTEAIARAKHKSHSKKSDHATETRHSSSAAKKRARAKDAAEGRKSARVKEESSPSADVPALSGDLALVKEAIGLARKGKTGDATDAKNKIADPLAQKLVEWFILRDPDSEPSFGRYAAFISSNPDWPSMAPIRRRAEASLWHERSSGAIVHGFTGDRPISSKGKLALARVLLGEGDRNGASRLVREVWRSEELSERTEADAYETFGDLLNGDDHRARMDKRIGAKDLSAARRAAKRLGSDELSIVKACALVRAKATKAEGALDDVATDARRDLGYTLCRIQWMLSQNRIDDATRLTLAAAPETMAIQDTDAWWRERRSLARKLLDRGRFQDAYQVVRTAAAPASEHYRADFHFMCGWIALRYLEDPLTAGKHFAHIDEGSVNPTVVARAHYWRGRVAEALGRKAEMRASYEAAARYPTAYYGQLANAKLGSNVVALRPPIRSSLVDAVTAFDERVRAANMLYEIGERDAVLSFVSDLAEQSSDAALLVALGELTGRYNDARAMLQIGKPALARGLALDQYAFPTIGIPPHGPIGPEIERSVIYSVARTESAFDQHDKSPANAVGLMQVTPEAGRDTAKRFGVSYDWDRLVSDPVYNTQMGGAELSALLSEYKGSHIMTFAGYNAGRGRIQEWVKQFGDPRDPKVDAVDWVERIPFSETRNYVQRVMENLQVYRVRFESTAPITAKADEHDTRKQTTGVPLPAAAADFTSSSR
jgi:soluble lytic murein transglycosylase